MYGISSTLIGSNKLTPLPVKVKYSLYWEPDPRFENPVFNRTEQNKTEMFYSVRFYC